MSQFRAILTVVIASAYMVWRNPNAITALTGTNLLCVVLGLILTASDSLVRDWLVGVQCTSAPPAIRNATLHYFDARGRAEAIRLLLEFTQVSFRGRTVAGHDSFSSTACVCMALL